MRDAARQQNHILSPRGPGIPLHSEGIVKIKRLLSKYVFGFNILFYLRAIFVACVLFFTPTLVSRGVCALAVAPAVAAVTTEACAFDPGLSTIVSTRFFF